MLPFWNFFAERLELVRPRLLSVLASPFSISTVAGSSWQSWRAQSALLWSPSRNEWFRMMTPEKRSFQRLYTCNHVAIHENLQHFLETLRKHFRALFISRRRGILWSWCLRISLNNWIPMEMETHLISAQLNISTQKSSWWTGSGSAAQVSWITKSSKRCWNPRRSCCYFLITLISTFKTWKILFKEATAEYVKLSKCQRDRMHIVGSCLDEFVWTSGIFLAFWLEYKRADSCKTFLVWGTHWFWI